MQAVLSITGLVVTIAVITVGAVGLHLFDAAQAQSSAFYLNLDALAKTSPRIILQYTRRTDPHIWLIRQNHVVLRSPNTGSLPHGPRVTEIVSTPTLAWRLVRQGDGYLWIIDWPLGSDLDLVSDLVLVMALVTAGASVAGAILGRRTTHRVLQPVANMSRSVETMLDRQQYRPIPAPSPHNDEFTQLATVLSRLITTLEVRRQRDRRMLADAAHQLRTPLEVIRGNLGILIEWDHIDPDTERDTLNALERAAQDMTRLVDDLLTLERAGNYQEALGRVALADLVEEVAEDAKAVASDHSVRYQIPIADRAEVNADLEASRRAIWVLVENALKYSPRGSEVALTLDTSEQGWALAVTSRGPAIPPTELDHIFDRFYRGQNTQGIAGNGLGLAIAKALMASQHGRLDVASDAQKTEFTLWWPIDKESMSRRSIT